MAQASYFLVREGWSGAIAHASSGVRVSIPGDPTLIRKFEYWSGQPVWETTDGVRVPEGPKGWRRVFDHDAMRWKWVSEAAGEEIWDTVHVYDLDPALADNDNKDDRHNGSSKRDKNDDSQAQE